MRVVWQRSNTDSSRGAGTNIRTDILQTDRQLKPDRQAKEMGISGRCCCCCWCCRHFLAISCNEELVIDSTYVQNEFFTTFLCLSKLPIWEHRHELIRVVWPQAQKHYWDTLGKSFSKVSMLWKYWIQQELRARCSNSILFSSQVSSLNSSTWSPLLIYELDFQRRRGKGRERY